MALTVADVINHARDQHPSLSPLNAPNQLAYRYLSREECDIFDQIFRRVPGMLAKQVVITFPLVDFAAGIDLTTVIPEGWKDLTDLFLMYASVPTQPNMIRATFKPWEQRDIRGQLPAYTLRDEVLYFLGNDTDYATFASATLTYTPQNADLTADTDTFQVTADARETFALGLAAFWMRRLIDDPAYKCTVGAYREVKAAYDEEKTRFLSRIFRVTQRQSYTVRAVR